LPGGLPGTHNLEASPAVQRCIDSCVAQGKLVAAICAAPSILAHKGLLAGKNATAFPSFQKDLQEGGALLSESYVVRDGQFLTARGMGVATQFGLALVEALVSPEKAADIRASIQWEA
ncbi:MAG: DJ-1/PfpI family protein, partial [Acutalibacter sp.]